MNLIDIHETFKTDEQCIEYLATLRWPDGVRCVVCGSDQVRQYSSPTKKQTGRKIYQCQEPTCKQQFTATSGTIFHDTHLPLTKWFLALSVIVDAKKGISAKQLQRHLNVGYKTAWYLAHRIRKAMEETGSPLWTGTVEIDETYIGGRTRGHARKFQDKDVVLGIRQRGGQLRLLQLENRKEATLYDAISQHVDKGVERIMTDDNRAYNFKDTQYHNAERGTIRHSRKEYVRGDIHTNTVESAFSLFKRGLVGSYHQLSIKHLQRYLNEFSYRFNRRDTRTLFEQTLQRMAMGKPMPFAELTADEQASV